ncbi:MAG: GTPase [Planctomycetota bacterium]|nr:MAG: GTPase [Planctomycetota bacterium]
MVQINFALREVNCKIVYYGPGMSGKTTNLEMVHQKAPPEATGELTSIATEGDRTLFFDFLPLDLGKVAGMTTKFQLYTVPGQQFYNSTRKLVLQGADGVIFVADSKKGKMEENIESLRNLQENLAEYKLDIRSIPLVMQWNKRDLPEVIPVELMEEKLNPMRVPSFEAVAFKGDGVFPTLKKLSTMVLETLNKKHGGGRRSMAPSGPPRPAAPTPPPVAAPPPPTAPADSKEQQLLAQLAANPNDLKLRKELLSHYLNTKQTQKAVEQLILIAQIQESRGNMALAQKCYQYILKLDPTNKIAQSKV